MCPALLSGDVSSDAHDHSQSTSLLPLFILRTEHPEDGIVEKGMYNISSLEHMQKVLEMCIR